MMIIILNCIAIGELNFMVRFFNCPLIDGNTFFYFIIHNAVVLHIIIISDIFYLKHLILNNTCARTLYLLKLARPHIGKRNVNYIVLMYKQPDNSRLLMSTELLGVNYS